MKPPGQHFAPDFEYFPVTSPENQEKLEKFKARIFNHPRLYEATLGLHERLARNGSFTDVIKEAISYVQQFPEDAVDFGSSYEDWAIYFKEKLDEEHMYDPVTEDVRRSAPEVTAVEDDISLENHMRAQIMRYVNAGVFVGSVVTYQEYEGAAHNQDVA